MKELEIDQMTTIEGGSDLETISMFACMMGFALGAITAIGLPVAWAIAGPTCIVGEGLAIYEKLG